MKHRRYPSSGRSAFTLLEVVVSVGGCALVALLLVGAMSPLLRQLSESAAASELEAVLAEVRCWVEAEAEKSGGPLRSVLAEGPAQRFLYREHRGDEGPASRGATIRWTVVEAPALQRALSVGRGTRMEGRWLYLLEFRPLEVPDPAGRALPYEARLWRAPRPPPGVELKRWVTEARLSPPTYTVRGVAFP